MAIKYRKKALTKLSSADKLEQALTITKPFYWVAVSTALVLFIALLLWSVLYEVNVSIKCVGVYVPTGVAHNYKSDVDGVVTQLNCKKDDVVQKGQPLFVYDDGASSYVCPVTGKISVLKVSLGQQVVKGEDLLYIRSSATNSATGAAPNEYDESLINKIYIAYVPYSQVSFISEDCTVQISPNTVLYDSSGSMTGRVTKIGDSVLKWEQIMSQVGNDYAAEVVTNLGPVVPVEITIDKDETSSNGYHWNKELGKQEVLYEGSFADIEIIYGTARPIEIFLPKSLEQEYA